MYMYNDEETAVLKEWSSKLDALRKEGRKLDLQEIHRVVSSPDITYEEVGVFAGAINRSARALIQNKSLDPSDLEIDFIVRLSSALSCPEKLRHIGDPLFRCDDVLYAAQSLWNCVEDQPLLRNLKPEWIDRKLGFAA